MKKYAFYLTLTAAVALPVLSILLYRAGISQTSSDDVVLSFANTLKSVDAGRKKHTAGRIGHFLQKNGFSYLIKGDGYQFSGNTRKNHQELLSTCIASIDKDAQDKIYRKGTSRCLRISRITIAWVEKESSFFSVFSVFLTMISFVPLFLLLWFYKRNKNRNQYLSQIALKARQLGRGQLPVIDRTPGLSEELSEITDAFAVMSASLLEAQRMLEEKVLEVENKNRQLAEHQNQIIAREKLVSIGEMAAGIAHEIGNPVAALIGMRDLLADENLDEEKTFTLNLMKEELERIHSLIQRMMDVSSGAGNEAPSVSALDLINNAVSVSSHHRKMRDVEFSLINIPDNVLLNQDVLQVFLNLFINSGNAMNGKGKITVSYSESGTVGVISVKDTGPGVKEEDMQRIFEPFYTGKLTADSHGLGLSISMMIMNRIGGTIRCIKSEQGAEFLLEFPLSRFSGV